jgi:hypothetical protein
VRRWLPGKNYTHKVSNAERKAEHYDSIENADINSELERVGCNDAKEITGESFVFYPSALLLGVAYSAVSVSNHRKY